VARLCGHEDWDLLLEAVDKARHRIAERWVRVKEQA
jgi:hypothetical protein